MYSPDNLDRQNRRADTPAEEQAKRGMMAAFNAMVGETNQATLNALWEQVTRNEQILESELRKEMSDDEIKMMGESSSP